MRIISCQLWSTPQNLLTLRLFSDQHLMPIIFGQLRELFCSHVIHNVISVWTCCFIQRFTKKWRTESSLTSGRHSRRATVRVTSLLSSSGGAGRRTRWRDRTSRRSSPSSGNSISEWVISRQSTWFMFLMKVKYGYQWFFMFEIILVILTPDSNSWIDIVNSSDHFFLFFKRIPTLASDYPQMKPKRFKDYVRNGLICCWFMIAFRHFLR